MVMFLCEIICSFQVWYFFVVILGEYLLALDFAEYVDLVHLFIQQHW